MTNLENPKSTTSDEDLVERTRSGDQRAFAELWRRHFRSGVRVARQFTSSIDADDLVSEAYTRIYQRVLAGGGPTGAFRPYLYTTIRNLASTWGAASREVQVDDIADFEDPGTLDDPAAIALDRTLTARAFRSLPERWQSVLWYTEVEGMDPHEVAPILGITANSVAALSYRAREGLRKAWLQAHINDAAAAGECQWTMSRMGEHARNGLTARDSERMTFHLATCTKCAIINEEVDEVGSRLALVMLPLVLGGVAGGALLSAMAQGGSAVAAASAASVIPALPVGIGASAATGASALVAATAGPVAVIGSLALAAAITGSVLLPPTPTPSPVAENTSSTSTTTTTSAPVAAVPVDQGPIVPETTPAPAGPLPADIPSDLGGAVGGVVDGVVGGAGEVLDSTVNTLTDNGQVASASLTLTGTGTPGATLALQAAGQVYATTAVDASGRFSLTAAAIPGGLSSLELVQTVDREYLRRLLPVGSLLGPVDHLIDALVAPLNLTGGGLPGVSIALL